MTTTPPREYRVDPDSATRIALHVMDDLWVDCTHDRALTSEQVGGWTRLVPAPPSVDPDGWREAEAAVLRQNNTGEARRG